MYDILKNQGSNTKIPKETNIKKDTNISIINIIKNIEIVTAWIKENILSSEELLQDKCFIYDKNKMFEMLNKDIYYNKNICKYILRKLDLIFNKGEKISYYT